MRSFESYSDVSRGILRSLDIRDSNRIALGLPPVTQISGFVVGCEPNPQGSVFFDIAGVVDGLHTDIVSHSEAQIHLPSELGLFTTTRIRFEGHPIKTGLREVPSFEIQILNEEIFPSQRIVESIANALAQAINRPIGFDATKLVISSYRNTILRNQHTLRI